MITYPPVRQDLAFVVPEDVPAGELVEAAREAAGPELREMRVFDVYRGEQVGEGRKSSRSPSRSSRPSGRSRTRTRPGCGSGSSTRCASGSARS